MTQRGNADFGETQRSTERTEGHRGGRRAIARRTRDWKFRSLEAWKGELADLEIG